MAPLACCWCRLALAAAIALLQSGAGWAQEAVGVEALTGTLRRVRESGTIILGYRRDSLPFSFLDARGAPAGYSVDLCREIAEDAAAELGIASLALAWRPVTAENRISSVMRGEVDLECGSTTGNAERRRQVAFSPVIFIAGTRLLVGRASPVRSLRDLAGRTVVVTAGTTNEAVVRSLAEQIRPGIRLLSAPDHTRSFAMLTAGEADAFANDDVLLFGWIAATPGGNNYRVTGELLSYEPYALMFRRDDAAFTALVERSFGRMARERRLRELYTRWFWRRLPNGQTMDLPMSPQLQEIFRMLGEPD